MRIVSDNGRVIAALRAIAAEVEAAGGFIHPDLEVHHEGARLWLALPRRCDPHSGRPPGDRPPGDAAVMLRIPNRLHIPVTDLDWDTAADHLVHRRDTNHLSGPQRRILAAMIDLFNACDKVGRIGRAYPRVALSGDPELLDLIRRARPAFATEALSPVELVVRSRLRKEIGEGEEGPVGFFMPMIDLLDHHPYGSRYERVRTGGDDPAAPHVTADAESRSDAGAHDWVIRIHHPTDDDRVFVRYNKADSLGVALGLGYFEDATRFVSPAATSLDIRGLGRVEVVGVGSSRRLPVARVWRTESGLRLGGLVLQVGRLGALQTLLAMPLAACGVADRRSAMAVSGTIIDEVLRADLRFYSDLAELCDSPGPATWDLRGLFAAVARHQTGLLQQMCAERAESPLRLTDGSAELTVVGS